MNGPGSAAGRLDSTYDCIYFMHAYDTSAATSFRHTPRSGVSSILFAFVFATWLLYSRQLARRMKRNLYSPAACVHVKQSQRVAAAASQAATHAALRVL